MEIPKISSLLSKRDIDFDAMNNYIIDIIGDNVIKAVQYYLNKSRKLQISSIEMKSFLPGYVFITLNMTPNVGDIIHYSGEQIVVEKNTVNKYLQRVEVIISLKAIDTNSAFVMYKNIRDVNKLIQTSKEDTITPLLKYDTVPIDSGDFFVGILESQIIENPEFADLLDILTKPEELSIMGFDSSKLSKTQLDLLKVMEITEQKISEC